MFLILIFLASSLSALYAADSVGFIMQAGGARRVQAVTPVQAALLLLEKEKITRENGDEKNEDTSIKVDGSGLVQIMSCNLEQVEREMSYIFAVDADCMENYKHNEPFYGHVFHRLSADSMYQSFNAQERDALQMLCESWVNMKIYDAKNPPVLNAATVIKNLKSMIFALNCSNHKEFLAKDIFEYNSDWVRDLVWHNSRLMLLKMDRAVAEELMRVALKATAEVSENGEDQESVASYIEKRSLELLEEADKE